MEKDIFEDKSDFCSLPSPSKRHKRPHENVEESLSETKQFKAQEGLFPTLTFHEFKDFFGFSGILENNIYKKYSLNTIDFDESRLSQNQKERLKTVFSLSKEELCKISRLNLFKVVYYVMRGHRHKDIQEILNLKTLSIVSTARLIAYKTGILTAQEFEHSGGRLEAVHSDDSDFIKMSYDTYSNHIPDFDNSKLSDDQKQRLFNFCSSSSQDFQKGKPTTFKVIYYVMLGFHHGKIAEKLNLKTSAFVSTARLEAFKQNYLTLDEFINSGGRSKMK